MLFCISILFGAANVGATELFEVHKNVRALGMGNAYVSMVDGEESLFINPAGLARTSGMYWTILDPAVGTNGMNTDSYEAYQDLKDSSTFAAALDSLYGEPIWVGLNAKTAVAIPYFALAYYKDIDASIIIDNPVSPTLFGSLMFDQGIAAGAGFKAGPMQIGAAVKRIHRVGGRQTFGADVISGVIGGDDPNVIFDELEHEGLGYSLDLGFNWAVPSPLEPTLSFVWKNAGDTKFAPLTAGEPAPPKDKQEWILGGSMIFDAAIAHFIPSIDLKHLENSDEQLGKKLHFGLEVGLPLLDLRAGFHQGYLSYGAGLDMGFLMIDAASWGVELGEYPGQFEDRRYMLQATIRLGFDMGFGDSESGGGAGGPGSKRGRFSRKKVKVRR